MHEEAPELPRQRDGLCAPLSRQMEMLDAMTGSSEHNLSFYELLQGLGRLRE